MTNSNTRAIALAERLTLGANALANFAENLSNSEWNKPVLGDGRTIGVVVHHVASVYPLEIELAQVIASGNPITDATMDVVNQMNADHAKEFANVGKTETIELLRKNSKIAADAVRSFTDKELDNASTVSLNANAPLTVQFFVEDHALRHSYHHFSKIKETLKK
ncbi:DinB family protein [Flavobacteriaceae bacterium S0862]|nr:DinB family protein [Flavobacteriaceae bacterium S0862]